MTHVKFEEKTYDSNSLDIKVWKKIFKLMAGQKKHLIQLFCFMIVVAIFDTALPYMTKIAIDYFAGKPENLDGLLPYAIIFFIGIALQSLIVYFWFTKAGQIEMESSYDIRNKVFTKVQTLSFSYFDTTPVGWIVSRMSSDIARLSEILSWSLIDLFWGLMMMTMISIVMLIVNYKLALLVLVIVPILAAISYWFQTNILKSYRQVRKQNSKITGDFNEGITGAKTTKTLVIEDENYKEFEVDTRLMKKSSIHAAILSSVFMPTVVFLGSLSMAGILWVGGNQVINNVIEFGTLMMFVQYVTQFYDPIKQIARLIAEFQMAQASAERVITLMETEPSVTDSPDVIAKYGTEINPITANYEEMEGNVSFKNVSFYYNEKEPVLNNFSLDVKRGQSVALVGETGSGKSTIVNLLCRFYEPISGEILIDGVDYRQRSLGWLHSNLGYVLQSPHLFSGSIIDNVRYGSDASEQDVIEACKLVNAHEFIMNLEEGYNTDVGEGGSRLSTGQKQLISFARAILNKPKIFVLDEATSSIDTETEQVIQYAIDNVLKNHTSFIVAHRLSTIVNADIILVIKKGEVVEKGTHQQLLEKKGYYYRLYTNQFNEQLQQQIMNGKG